MGRNSDILHTVRLMLTALGILFFGVSVFAYAWGGQSPWPVRAPFDRYIDVGTAQGTRMLEQDLAEAHPQGSDAAALLTRLRQSGMDCEVRGAMGDQFNCTYRQPRNDRRMAEVQVRFDTQGRNLGTISSALSAPGR